MELLEIVVWSQANAFFQLKLEAHSINEQNCNQYVNEMNNLVYNYFRYNYGLVNENSNKTQMFAEKYKSYNRNKLKRVLKYLKGSK